MIILAGLVWFFFWPIILLGWALDKLGTAIGKAIFWSDQGL